MTATRCDLHLHSSASRKNDDWYSTHFDCPESYADPVRQYQLCKARGMHLVTLTDHDTIAGGLELLSYPDFFLSEEVTTTFPESGCQIHVLAWNITPKQHDAIQAVRSNVYTLVDLLTSQHIVHACAHPLLSSNRQLDASTLEKMILLFPAFESRNGLTDRRLENALDSLLRGLDADVVARLEHRHGIAARGLHPHRKVLSAGSDDHAHRRCGSTYTMLTGVRADASTFLDALSAGATTVHGHQADINAMHLTVSHTTYGFLSRRHAEDPTYRDPFMDLIDVVAGRERGATPIRNGRDEFVANMLKGALRQEQGRGAQHDVHKVDALPSEADDARLMAGIARINDGLLAHALDELTAAAVDLNMYRMFGGLRDLLGAVGMVVPYLFAADHFAAQYQQARRVMHTWTASPWPTMPERLALFSDSLENTDGVASACRTFVARAVRKQKEVRVPYCGPRPAYADQYAAEIFTPLACATSYENPLYPGMHFYVPSLLDTIDWLWRKRITCVEVATPGPMGLLGLVAARLLRLPITASYHTELPEQVRELSQKALLEDAARTYVRWFYRMVDRVFVFSAASHERLVALGIPPANLELLPVAIEPSDFSPAFASPDSFALLGIAAGERPVVLSVGRLSAEKNLRLVVDAVALLQDGPRPPLLVIVGDGPDRAALERECADKSFVRFVGVQHGEPLRTLYASAQAFVFASRIDSLGLVAMEALSSGTPTLVPLGTGIAEIVENDVSGICYRFDAQDLADALRGVLACPERRARLSKNARGAMVERWHKIAFDDVWRTIARGARSA